MSGRQSQTVRADAQVPTDMKVTLQGYIDLVEQGLGFAHLSGWLIRPPEIPDEAYVTLSIDGHRFAEISDFFDREDLTSLTQRAAGFSVVGPEIELHPSSRIKFSYGQIDFEVDLPKERGAFKPRLAVDVSGPDYIEGWIFDPLSTESDLEIVIGGQKFQPLLGSIRPDVPFGSGDDQKARSFKFDCAQIISKFEKHSSDTSFDHYRTEFSLRRRGETLYEGMLTLGRPMEASASCVKRGPKQTYAKFLIKGVTRFFGRDYVIDCGSVAIKALAISDSNDIYTHIIQMIFPSSCILGHFCITNSSTNRSAVVSIKDINDIDETNYFANIEEFDGKISATILDLSVDEQPGLIDLRCFGRDQISQALTVGRVDEQIWSVDGPIRCRLELSERQILNELRGKNPNVAITADAPRTVEFLGSQGHVVAVAPLHGFGPAEGRLEVAQSDRISGWLANRGAPDRMQLIDVYVNGVRYHTGMASELRQDLLRKGISSKGGGFKMKPSNPSAASSITVTAHPALMTEPLSCATSGEFALPAAKTSAHLFRYITPQAFSKIEVAIVIPVYNAFSDLERCVASVLPSLRSGVRLIIIDDASTDPRVCQMLDALECLPSVKILKNGNNLGFTRTANRGIAEAGLSDVILLNSDTIVPDGWVSGLMVAAYSDIRIASVTPMSNNAGAFSVPEPNVENGLPWGLSVDESSRLFRQGSIAAYPRLPTGNGFCMYIRREALDAVGPLDEVAFPIGYGEENDFCMRALRAGFEHVLDDRTYVYHRRSASFGELKADNYAAGREVLRERYPEYHWLISAFEGDGMNSVRWRCRKAINEYIPTEGPTKKRILFVISTDTGGTPQTNIDLMLNLPDEFECYVLKCDTITLRISLFSAGEDIILEEHTLRDRLTPALHTTREYTEMVGSMLVRYAIDLVHIRHLGWHGADLPIIARALHLPVVFSIHDFYTVCPTVKLLDENKIYCGGVCTDSKGDCSPELWKQSSMPSLKDRFVHRWREIFRPALESANTLVTTSPFARDLVISHFPSLIDRDFRVIPHGRTFDQTGFNCVAPRESEPLRVLVAGSISPAKGSELIKAMADADIRNAVHFHILGDPGILQGGPNITIHGRYKRQDFHLLTKEIKPHIGAVLSIWPETYCHTLTELWAGGIPVVGIDIGAVGERISQHGGGWLLPLGSAPDEIFEVLLSIKGDPGGHRLKVSQVLDWHMDFLSRYNARDMSELYAEIYNSTIPQRKKAASLAGLGM
jgi:GT2 family glycosyltransferase/glycosyltransferase involved in cell wall biosynthesis